MSIKIVDYWVLSVFTLIVAINAGKNFRSILFYFILFLNLFLNYFKKKIDSNLNLTNCEYKASTGFLQCNSTVGSERCQAKFEGVAKEFKQFAIGIKKLNK